MSSLIFPSRGEFRDAILRAPSRARKPISPRVPVSSPGRVPSFNSNRHNPLYSSAGRLLIFRRNRISLRAARRGAMRRRSVAIEFRRREREKKRRNKRGPSARERGRANRVYRYNERRYAVDLRNGGGLLILSRFALPITVSLSLSTISFTSLLKISCYAKFGVPPTDVYSTVVVPLLFALRGLGKKAKANRENRYCSTRSRPGNTSGVYKRK